MEKLTSILKNPLYLIGILAGVYFLFFNKKTKTYRKKTYRRTKQRYTNYRSNRRMKRANRRK